jgi:hypothetical protein
MSGHNKQAINRSITTQKKFIGKVVKPSFKFLRQNLIGTLLILFATLVFFWPLIIHIGSYSSGGDAMFNAWTLDRDQHCILGEGCPSYANGNIYFPHKDTMLYSETQLSAGLVTLPLHLINQNPLFVYNVWTVASFFFSGWFMYLLVKYLSKGKEWPAILAGLIFEFAPFKMAAIWHLQNLSIFCLPLAVLLILKYFETKHKKYLWFLLPTLLYQFYASWYQMVFMLIALATLLGGMLICKLVRWRPVLIVSGIMLIAIIATLPLAKQYVQFSKTDKATFGIVDQTVYSSSVSDYFIPNSGTLIGKVYYHFRPGAQVNAYNLDSNSYQGIVLYVLAAGMLILTFIRRKHTDVDKKKYKNVVVYVAIALVGFVLSLGPLLKLKGDYTYAALGSGVKLAIPMPYILVDKLLPQLSFIRAIGRISVLCLFALCCLLASFAIYLESSSIKKRYKQLITASVILLAIIELMPIHFVPMLNSRYAYNLTIPPVYKYIKSQKSIDDIIVLQAQNYPGVTIEFARPETVLWAGYDNKNVFNGYSGYTPPTYFTDYADFVNFSPNEIPKMKALGLRYVLVDTLLTKSKPNLLKNISQAFPNEVYHDSRYALFKIQS